MKLPQFKLSGIVTQRLRGFRVIDIAALVTCLVLALTVYAFKTSAGAQRTDITDIEGQIRDETRQVRLLRAEIAHLESPDRLERLAGQYAGQAPISARQEVTPDALPQVAVRQAAAPKAASQAAAPQVAGPQGAAPHAGPKATL
jgi:hypothetical protein